MPRAVRLNGGGPAGKRFQTPSNAHLGADTYATMSPSNSAAEVPAILRQSDSTVERNTIPVRGLSTATSSIEYILDAWFNAR